MNADKSTSQTLNDALDRQAGVAEVQQRIAAGGFFGHAGGDVVLDPHLEVRLELSLDLAVYLRPVE